MSYTEFEFEDDDNRANLANNKNHNQKKERIMKEQLTILESQTLDVNKALRTAR